MRARRGSRAAPRPPSARTWYAREIVDIPDEVGWRTHATPRLLAGLVPPVGLRFAPSPPRTSRFGDSSAPYARPHKRPRLGPREGAFGVALEKVWQDWCSPLVLVKPATVITLCVAQHAAPLEIPLRARNAHQFR